MLITTFHLDHNPQVQYIRNATSTRLWHFLLLISNWLSVALAAEWIEDRLLSRDVDLAHVALVASDVLLE